MSSMPFGRMLRRSSNPPLRSVGRTIPTRPRVASAAIVRSPLPSLFDAGQRQKLPQAVDDRLRRSLNLSYQL
jgi:hypothetical protein